MKIVVFGVLTDVVGKSAFEMEAPKDSDSLLQNLFSEYPFLKNYKFQLVLNKEKVETNTLLNQEDEIALLPPYSGG
ncbi:MAG: MoaD/ThiS family protein [Bacteroidia bacterium]